MSKEKESEKKCQLNQNFKNKKRVRNKIEMWLKIMKKNRATRDKRESRREKMENNLRKLNTTTLV